MKKKPCPFCGGTRLSMVKSDCVWHDPPVAYSVSCAGGDCHGHIFSLGHDLFKTEKEAVEAWNERADADEIEKLRAALKDMAKHIWRGDWDKLDPETRALMGEKE
jgi:Lar family restriction alleviation protein